MGTYVVEQHLLWGEALHQSRDPWFGDSTVRGGLMVGKRAQELEGGQSLRTSHREAC